MRPLLPLSLLVALALAGPAAAEFVAGTEDVPLMPGLATVGDSALAFDKPEGRIVTAEAVGKVSRRAAQEFYAKTLPQLGWAPAGDNAWRREGERLQLEFRERGGQLTVGFTLAPR